MNSSYLIKFEQDTLHVSFNPDLSGTGDRIVRDASIQLQILINQGQLQGGTLLKINGPLSVLVSYVLAHELGHLYSAIAVFDPRLGGEQKNRYVVTISSSPEYAVGDILEFNQEQIEQVVSTVAANQDNSSFLLSVTENCLKLGFNPEIQAPGNQIVKDVAARLEELIISNKLKGGALLNINGRASALASFVIAHKLAHLYSAIAVFDPKMGDKGLARYVVTIEHGSEYQVGDVMAYPVLESSPVKIVICGSPNTGKTCLREGLKQAIKNISGIPDDFAYLFSGCPDGDGAWFLETARKYPEVAKEMKQNYKASFTPEFAREKAQQIKGSQNSLVVFDVGGKITQENWLIMSEATHAVIVAQKQELDNQNTRQWAKEWQEFCQSLDLPVIALIYSDRDGQADIIQDESGLLRGTVHNLTRDQDVSSRPMVKELAQLLTDLANSRSRLS